MPTATGGVIATKRKATADNIVAATVAVIRDGLSGNKAAEQYNVTRSTLQEYVKRAKADLDVHHHEARREVRGSGIHRVLLIGDAHDSPFVDKDRFRWMGRYAVDNKADQVVQIGDIASMDSLNGHEKNESWRGRAKPTFQMDMASLEEALEAFDDGMGGRKIPKHITLGNHEARIWFFEDRNPETFGMMRDELDRVLRSNGWSYSPFGQHWNFQGVDFAHCPLNGMNRPAGGMNVAQMAGRHAMRDFCFGHTHRVNIFSAIKMNGELAKIIEAGCALPFQHIERYAGHALSGWSWGCWMLVIRDGRIAGHKWIEMSRLQELYG